MYGSLPVGKPKDGWVDAGTRGAIKLLGTAAWKRLAGDWKICGCKIEEARAQNRAAPSNVMVIVQYGHSVPENIVSSYFCWPRALRAA
jgi:hypothetical protein